MGDALGNGIIGARGAAVCCGVYFVVKALVNVTKRIKINGNNKEVAKPIQNKNSEK